MTTYRYRVKFDPDPRSLWRDIVVGADQTLNEFQSVLNRSVGLNQVKITCGTLEQIRITETAM